MYGMVSIKYNEISCDGKFCNILHYLLRLHQMKLTFMILNQTKYCNILYAFNYYILYITQYLLFKMID